MFLILADLVVNLSARAAGDGPPRHLLESLRNDKEIQNNYSALKQTHVSTILPRRVAYFIARNTKMPREAVGEARISVH